MSDRANSSDHAEAYRGLRRWHPNPMVQSAIDRIRRHGWAITAVSELCVYCDSAECPPPDCPFAYTSGMGLHDIPELAVYGVDAYTGGALLDELACLLHAHDWRILVDDGVEVSVRALDRPVRLIEMVDKSDLTVTNELFPDSPALQAVWPDELGSYPWDAGYALEHDDQHVKGIHDTGVGAGRVRGPRVITTSTAPNRAQRRRAQRTRRRTE
ncbi:hypothetical protein GCM10009624_03680 [Gordonia sinesedis]